MNRLMMFLAAISVAACAAPETRSASGAELIGTWRQQAGECATGSAPIAELIFSANHEFSVTWLPFETYKDYWGTWVLDDTTHVLTLNVSGGNYIPADLTRSGQVSVDAHQLVLNTVSLGTLANPGASRCTAPFRR